VRVARFQQPGDGARIAKRPTLGRHQRHVAADSRVVLQPGFAEQVADDVDRPGLSLAHLVTELRLEPVVVLPPAVDQAGFAGLS